MAEEASYAIGGDSKTGAGRSTLPWYWQDRCTNVFYENQVTGVNPHDHLDYEESARS